MMNRMPILFIVSGPSGSGKGTMMGVVLDNVADIHKVVNYTTRSPRPGEKDGVDYNFIDEDTFLDLVENGGIFEYEQVYNDYYYGSPSGVLSGDSDQIMELDYKGHRRYRQAFSNVCSIFLLPPSFGELQQRIKKRADEDNLNSRLQNADEQVLHADEYDYVLLNDNLERCAEDILSIVRAERARSRGQAFLEKLTSDHD